MAWQFPVWSVGVAPMEAWRTLILKAFNKYDEIFVTAKKKSGHRRNHGPKAKRGPKLEARRAESGGGVLGKVQRASSPPARGSGGAL